MFSSATIDYLNVIRSNALTSTSIVETIGKVHVAMKQVNSDFLHSLCRLLSTCFDFAQEQGEEIAEASNKRKM